jgi:hypothetical protein
VCIGGSIAFPGHTISETAQKVMEPPMHTDAHRWTAPRGGQLIIRPADAGDALARLARPIPLCADESCRTLADLDRLDGKYAVIAIKLDKVGGLTEALALAAEARRRGLRIMVGGVISTSLGLP